MFDNITLYNFYSYITSFAYLTGQKEVLKDMSYYRIINISVCEYCEYCGYCEYCTRAGAPGTRAGAPGTRAGGTWHGIPIFVDIQEIYNIVNIANIVNIVHIQNIENIVNIINTVNIVPLLNVVLEL